jgi:hypothetical protein
LVQKNGGRPLAGVSGQPCLTFKEELLALVRKHNVEFDESYLWD